MASPLALKPTHGPVHDCCLGNRSALDWVIDQYRVDRGPDGEITSDPNRADDEDYILRLVGQVITVSIETVKMVTALPPLDDAQPTRPQSPPPSDVSTQGDLDATHIYVSEDPPSTSP